MISSERKDKMTGFTYIDFFGTKYHFTYNEDDGYWWNDKMSGDLYAVNRNALRRYEIARRIIWDKE